MTGGNNLQNGASDGIQACVFDAYGTLFDVNSAAERESTALGDLWQPLAELWRSKQLQYTWLRSLSGQHVDFWQVTGDALDFAMASLDINDRILHKRLMNLYLDLDAYPEVEETLARLKAGGMRLAILSNGSPEMLSAAVKNAGIASLLDAVLSVEEVGVYKTHHAVYQLAVDRMDAAPGQICFVSSNGWDAYAASAFGLRVAWCNRFGQVAERIPEPPEWNILTLSELPAIVGMPNPMEKHV
jgi:2-haloacid dehalogenase